MDERAAEPARTRSYLVPSRRVDGKFQNPVPTQVGTLRLIFKAMPLYIKNHEQRTPLVAPGPFVTDPSAYAEAPPQGLRVTWFGHSGMLLEIDGVRLLVDPVWEERASPRQWFGPRRFFPPTIALNDLPPLDGILTSHDHYDHMGEETIRTLAGLACSANAIWVTALGVGSLLRSWGVDSDKVVELDWMGETVVRSAQGAELLVTAVPARHFSGRSLLNRFGTLWGSYVLRGARHRLYFGADSGLWEGFEEIATSFGPFDLTMLEIGAFNELWKDIHLGPDNAAKAFLAMRQEGLFMPIHWGLFDLALHAWKQPMERMIELAEEFAIPLWSPEPGRPTDVLVGQPLLDLWWKRHA